MKPNNGYEENSNRINHNHEWYRILLNSLDEGIMIVKFLTGKEEKVYDAYIIDANEAVYQQTGFSRIDIKDKLASEILPVISEVWFSRFNEIASSLITVKFEEYSHAMKRWLEIESIPLDNEKIFGIYVRDITTRKFDEQLLSESEPAAAALNGMAHCRIIVDENGVPYDYTILSINDNYTRILGVPKEKIEGKRVRDVFPGIENFSFNYIAEYGKVALEGKELITEAYFEITNQYLSIYAFSLVPGEFIAVFTDITMAKQTEISYKRQTELLQSILNSIPVMITIYNPGLSHIIVNKEFETTTGWNQEAINRGDPMEMVYPDAEYRKEVAGFMQRGKGWRDFTMTLKDGRKIESSWANIKLPDGRQVGIGIDISERKRAEETLRTSEERYRKLAGNLLEANEEIKKALSEKEFLMKEIHHRVKNNLQIIASLLRLQMDTLENQSLKDVFNQGANRVKTIAMIHEKLYSENLTDVLSVDYIPELVKLIENSYKMENQNVSIDYQITKMNMKIDNAVYLGLLINEILSNSFKHAFSGRESGKITIILRPGNNNKFDFIISDNGKGFPAEVGNKGLGLVLINTLIEQLDGEMEIRSNNGTEYRLSFKENTF
jgi:PAS domain S-box-containing protein